MNDDLYLDLLNLGIESFDVHCNVAYNISQVGNFVRFDVVLLWLQDVLR